MNLIQSLRQLPKNNFLLIGVHQMLEADKIDEIKKYVKDQAKDGNENALINIFGKDIFIALYNS